MCSKLKQTVSLCEILFNENSKFAVFPTISWKEDNNNQTYSQREAVELLLESSGMGRGDCSVSISVGAEG